LDMDRRGLPHRHISRCPDDTRAAGRKLGEALRRGDAVMLRGDVGAGKTVFVCGIAGALGVEGFVTSPTYTFSNTYCGAVPLFHYDAYRIENPDDAVEIGLADSFGDESGVTVVEWAENVSPYFPPEYYDVRISKTAELNDKREITVRHILGGIDENPCG
jgi:tRNA threonylcarbamoyladenosine biosynthesis protein TsaE